MIEISGLSKIYITNDIRTAALQDIDLDIEKGEFVAVMGPSGCGKSTLLNILGLLDNSSSGEYYLNDVEVSHLSENRRSGIRKRNVGFVFQNFNLIDELTVFENIELPLMYHNVSKQERKKEVEKIIKKMGIEDKARQFPFQLSGGQQQRVAVARAVISDPLLILADEPTGNLDSANGVDVMQLLKNLNKEGTTIVMVTHSQAYAEYAARIIRLIDGRIVNNQPYI